MKSGCVKRLKWKLSLGSMCEEIEVKITVEKGKSGDSKHGRRVRGLSKLAF